MKRLISILAAAIVSVNAVVAQNYKLSDLWARYEAAKSADKPKTEAEILRQIKEEAAARRYAVDFYDAATKYVEAVSRRNWKERDKAKQALEAEIKEYADPIVTFTWLDQYCYQDAQTLKQFMLAHTFSGRNEPFYRGISSILGGSMPHFIMDDSEYVLWRIASKTPGDTTVTNRLKERPYPADAALEYLLASNLKDRGEALSRMEELASKYDGTAAGLFPKAYLLSSRLGTLRETHPQTDVPYRELYADCISFESLRNSFKGDEKFIAETVTTGKYLKETLESRRLDVSFSSNDILVIFQNLTEAKLSLGREDSNVSLNTWDVKNPRGSFFRQDTVRISLGALDDGEYRVEAVNGKNSAQATYRQYTLSIADRRDSRGLCVYVADFKSGKPLPKATVYLLLGREVVASASMKLDGFTPLPSSFTRQISTKHSYRIYAEADGRKSLSVWLDAGEDIYSEDYSATRCNIYRDRGAYNPGDELQFKAILFNGNPAKKLQALQGRKITAVLRDSEGNEVSDKSLKTGSFGSVSGSFIIPKGLRNGRFCLEIREGKNIIGTSSFRVDEFVLPTFEIALDKTERLFLEGDDVPVSGTVTSYSGHKLSGARAVLRVDNYGRLIHEEETTIGPDNRFSFSIPGIKSGYYNAIVKVVDPSGETIETATWIHIGTSLSVEMKLENAAPGEFSLVDEAPQRRWAPRVPRGIVTDDSIRISFQAMDDGGNPVPLAVSYELSGRVASGSVASGETIDLAGIPSGLYTLKASVQERGAKGSSEMKILVLRPSDTKVPDGVEAVFIPGPETVDGSISARFGSSSGTAYSQISLYGEKRTLLLDKSLTVSSISDFSAYYKASFPDAVRLQVFWFKDGKAHSFSREYRREKTRYSLPLAFTRFTDSAYPGTEYTFTLKTAAGVEALAAVWDKSIDAVASNYWPLVSPGEDGVPEVLVSSMNGTVSGAGAQEEEMVFYSIDSRSVTALGALNKSMDRALLADESVSDDTPVRSKFETALTFQPHLLSAKDGNVSFKVRTSDKLSTCYVRVYAHNASMQNAVVQGEMVISLPVKVQLLEPRYLYEGDIWEAVVTVSSIASDDISGVVKLTIPGGNIQSAGITVPAGETASVRFPVTAPAVMPGSEQASLAVTASFVAPEFSDAVRVEIPVYKSSQNLTEAHSAVLLPGMSRDDLLADLRSRFVNVPASSATLKEVSILDMVREAIPSHIEPKSNDVLSLSEAWYVLMLSEGEALSSALLRSPVRVNASERVSSSELLSRIMTCRNEDGGFAWFEGMESSPVITAVLLERMAKMKARGVDAPEVASSVKYLDNVQFGKQKPLWCGWLSDAQYMHVRAMYADVPFTVTGGRLKDFKKYAKSYLTPSGRRGLNGQIIAKARRLATLKSLDASAHGTALAKAWGIKLTSRLRKSIKADVTSLLEYAVPHPSGGCYFPNAVMPWRGLLESEAYAHAMLCNLLSSDGNNLSSTLLRSPVRVNVSERLLPSEVADGIRLWLMLQKETQKWDADPAFVDAIDAILSGSEDVLNTKVLALSATYEAPFQDIQAAGNGFTIERKIFKGGVEMAPETELSVGDKITVRYLVWSAENRSFVRLAAAREASLQPVNQLSGLVGRNLYRNVKTDRTEYYWETCPEEKTVLEEEFFVTRPGRFTAPVISIESLYAPHYRANGGFGEAMVVQ